MMPTYINYGIVVSIDVERIPELKALLEDLGAKLIYQKASSNHLIIAERQKPNDRGSYGEDDR